MGNKVVSMATVFIILFGMSLPGVAYRYGGVGDTVYVYETTTTTVTVTVTAPAPLTYTYSTQITLVVPKYTTAVFNFTYHIPVTSVRREWVLPFPWPAAMLLVFATLGLMAGAWLWSYRPKGV